MITHKWIGSIQEINKNDWNEIFGTETILKSYELHKTVEGSLVEDFSYSYLHVSIDNQVVSIIPCFSYRVRLDTLADKFTKAVISKIRRFFPFFLTQKILFAGTPLSICDHLWGLNIRQDDKDYPAVIKTIVDQLVSRSKEEKCIHVILKEIPANEKDHFEEIFKHQFIKAESLPNSLLPISKELSPFPGGLKTRYKYRIKKSLKKFQLSDFELVIERDFGKYAHQMENLYLQVLNKSETPFEELNAQFFRNVANDLNDKSLAVLGFSKQGDLVCFLLVLEEEDVLNPLYIGLDYSYRDDGDLYFNCLYKIIEEAEKQNKRWVKFGQNSYLAKAYAGSLFEKLYLGVYSNSFLWRLLIKYFTNCFFPVTDLPKTRCYRQDSVEIVSKMANTKGVIVEPVNQVATTNI